MERADFEVFYFYRIALIKNKFGNEKCNINMIYDQMETYKYNIHYVC